MASAMNPQVTRRRLLASAAAFGALPLLAPFQGRAIAGAATELVVERRSLSVKGRAASVLGVRQKNDVSGLTLNPDQRFIVNLRNALAAPTIIHWHGQTPPPDQDGV